MAENQRKAELTAELNLARSRIAQNFSAFRTDLDVLGRMKKAITKNPAVWAGGAALLGLVFSILPGRRKKAVGRRKGAEEKVAAAGKAGLLLGVLKIAFDLSRPVLAKWAGRRVAAYMESRGNARRFSP